MKKAKIVVAVALIHHLIAQHTTEVHEKKPRVQSMEKQPVSFIFICICISIFTPRQCMKSKAPGGAVDGKTGVQ